jgi:hypothetical protein
VTRATQRGGGLVRGTLGRRGSPESSSHGSARGRRSSTNGRPERWWRTPTRRWGSIVESRRISWRQQQGRRRPVVEDVPDSGFPKGNGGGQRGHKVDRVTLGAGELHGPNATLGVVATGTVHGRRQPSAKRCPRWRKVLVVRWPR